MDRPVEPVARIDFPLTKFLVALMKRPLAQRMKADPQKAADGYGISLDTARFYIAESLKTDDQWPMKSGRRG
jgi:hypothetical protein